MENYPSRDDVLSRDWRIDCLSRDDVLSRDWRIIYHVMTPQFIVKQILKYIARDTYVSGEKISKLKYNYIFAVDSKSKTQAWINSTPPLEQMSRPEQWKRQSQASQASSSSSKSQPLSDVDR